ncbi:MAG: glycosyltransferase family 2 protein [Planctomycetota bacterium]
MNPALSVVILTQNEEANVAAALRSVLPWAAATCVVDSYSVDRTADIARSLGAIVHEHRFEHWADQRNWALDNLPLSTPWVFFLDADEWVPEETRRSIDNLLADVPAGVAAVRVRFDYRFLGRSIPRSFDSHAVVRIIRLGRARWSAQGAREYCAADGAVLELAAPIVHEDRKGLAAWIEKQRRNALREALATLAAERDACSPPPERKVRAWLRRNVYRRLPLFARPLAYFFYRYFLRLAFLEGLPGLVYTVLHGFWYHFLVDALCYERKLPPLSAPPVPPERVAAEKDRLLHDPSPSR